LFGLNGIVAFWFAYIVTRPLGATFADWMGKPYLGGLEVFSGSFFTTKLPIAHCLQALLVRIVDALPCQNDTSNKAEDVL